MPRDSFNRNIDYLRVSVTDRCNLRCVYCLPESYGAFAPAKDVLGDDELLTLISSFVEVGFSRIRITGGEPLVRSGIVELVRRVAALDGVTDVAMSTNGLLLRRHARALAEAGLKRVNVSLDSLDAEKFHEITRHGEIETVLAGIDAALDAGISPVKLNVVVARGFNESEIGAFARLTETRPVHVRFIELMPMGETGFFSEEKRVPYQEMLEAASPLEPLTRKDWPAGNGPAHYYRRPGAPGTVGFISALSCGFCGECNRVRLSARGVLVPCLDGWKGFPLGEFLRGGAGREEIKREILRTIEEKPERHFMVERASGELHAPSARTMCSIGG